MCYALNNDTSSSKVYESNDILFPILSLILYFQYHYTPVTFTVILPSTISSIEYNNHIERIPINNNIHERNAIQIISNQ